MYSIVSVLIPAICLLSIQADAGERSKKLTAEDIQNLTWAIPTVVSPDGIHALYSVLGVDDDGQRGVTSWMCRSADGSESKQVLANFKGVSSAIWSPDGSQLAFLATDPDSGSGKQLFVANADATDARLLTAMENGVIQFRWAADSRTLAFTASHRPQQSTSIEVVGSPPPGSTLWTIELDDESPVRVTGDHQNVIDFAWSPTGDQFAAAVAAKHAPNVTVPQMPLVILNRSDGETVRVVAEEGTAGCNLAWSPDGKWIAAPVATPRKLSRRLALFPQPEAKQLFRLPDFVQRR